MIPTSRRLIETCLPKAIDKPASGVNSTNEREPNAWKSVGLADFAQLYAIHADEADALGKKRSTDARGHAREHRERGARFLDDARRAPGLAERIENLGA